MHQLTDSGEPGSLYNGVADWLYEEEILGTDTALWPHAASLAFLSFNDTEVEPGTCTLYTGAANS